MALRDDASFTTESYKEKYMDKYRKQEMVLVIVCSVVALVMLLSWSRHLFS
jgi:hypothetical protein